MAFKISTKTYNFKSLRVKVAIVSILIITAIVSILALYIANYGKFVLRNELKNRATSMIRNFAYDCEIPVLLEDAPALHKLTDGLMADEAVVYAEIRNEKGRELMSVSKAALMRQEVTAHPNDHPGPDILLTEKNGFLWVALPVRYSFSHTLSEFVDSNKVMTEKPLGTVTIVFSMERTDNLIYSSIQSIAMVAVAILFISIIIVVFFMNRVIQPLMSLVEGHRKVASGDLSWRVTVERNDELGDLSSAFNVMVEQLENNQKVIEEHNRDLEEKIRDRTKALLNSKKALKDSEAKYRSIFDNTGTAMLMVRDDGIISLVNAEFEILTGYSRAEVEITKHWTEFVLADDVENMKVKQFFRIPNLGDAPIKSEFRLVDKNGHIKICFMTVDSNPGTKESIVSLIDLTEKKTLESQLLQAQKLEAIGTLAGGIAHDFNNLLMGIQGYTSLIMLTLGKDHSQYSKLLSIEDQVQSGATLTRQLLGFARGGNYEIKSTDLNEIIEKTSEIFGRTKKEIVIRCQYEKSLWTTDVDHGQIEQVLLNLYVNAWQAMPAGGEIYLQTENVILDADYCKSFSVPAGKYVKISVADTGTGMDEKTKKRIFEPFFTTKEMGRGTGLGLATVYGVIAGHKGIIDVYSERGLGTTFTIYLPASEKEAVKDEKICRGLLTGKETVLVIDDEAVILEVTKDLVEALGYKVSIAQSGQEAIEIYKANHEAIDLIILDMIMPEMSGGETYDRLKSVNPNAKVILASGYTVNNHVTSILDKGCQHFIQKPFNLTDMSLKIREALDSP
jgi:PAS domain S-box-containing protein